jgi:hypothetical protein
MRETSPPLEETDRQSGPATASGTATEQRATTSEEIHIRNFDVSRAYDLTIRVRDDDGLAFGRRYRLRPGKTESVLGRLPSGEYEVVAELDGRRRDEARCRVDPSPEGTALVEVGNGTVSVTQGLYA